MRRLVRNAQINVLNMTRQKGVWFNQPLGMVVALVVSVAAAWSLPPTQDLKGSVVSAKGLPIAAALCTLKGVGLPAEGISVTTNERGEFDFPGLEPGQYDLVCAAVGHLPASQNALKVTSETPTPLQIVLPEPEKLRQTIEVHETATPSRHGKHSFHRSRELPATQYLALGARTIPGGFASGSGGCALTRWKDQHQGLDGRPEHAAG